jgi:dihydroorotate dehydrogenase electron transfer subunit
MGILCPEISQKAKPGQFVMIKVSDRIDPLLRRPFSVYSIGKKTLEIIYDLVGKGTRVMSEMKTGEEVDLLGPLGNGFVIKKGIKKAVLVAGGIGVAPLRTLGEQLNGRTDITVYLGAKSSSGLLGVPEFESVGKVIIATEDGSTGFRGKVTDLIERDLKASQPLPHLFSCGPPPMLEKISEFAQKKGFPCQVSLEAYMGCGIGACLGCAVKVKTRGNKCDYRRACTDGPVFESSTVIWR